MSINHEDVVTSGRRGLWRSMKTLPRVLLCQEIAEFSAHAAEDAPQGRFALVDAATSVDILRRLITGHAAGIAMTGWRTAADIQRLETLLSVAEAEENRIDGSTVVVAVTSGIALQALEPRGTALTTGRLAALVWDRKDLKKRLGATGGGTNVDEGSPAFAAARAAVLLAAASAGIVAYDSVPEAAETVLKTAFERSRRDGFHGCLVSDVAQAAIMDAACREPDDVA